MEYVVKQKIHQTSKEKNNSEDVDYYISHCIINLVTIPRQPVSHSTS